jgi:hypothetical protein
LDKRHTQKHEGAKLILVPEAQKRSDLLCDIGSDRQTLEKAFPQPDFADLQEEWHLNKGSYAVDDDAVMKRADRLRIYLAELIEGLPAAMRATLF